MTQTLNLKIGQGSATLEASCVAQGLDIQDVQKTTTVLILYSFGRPCYVQEGFLAPEVLNQDMTSSYLTEGVSVPSSKQVSYASVVDQAILRTQPNICNAFVKVM